MKRFIHALAMVGALSLASAAYANHKSDCKNVHGKVAVITDTSVTVNDHLYKVGDSTRITKNGEKVKVSELKAGDIVCLDARGKDDVDAQIAAITVLSTEDAKVYREKEKETTREKEKVKEKVSESEK